MSRRHLLRAAGLGAGLGATGLATDVLARIAGIGERFTAEAREAVPDNTAENTAAGESTAGLDPGLYSLDPQVLYLNHASIGTIPRAVQRAHASYLTLCEENPWLYMWGGEWEAPREAVRAQAAQLIGAAAPDIVFSHNTTETFNLLAQGLPRVPGDEVLIPELNHPGASVCFAHQADRRGFSVRRFALDSEATHDPERLVSGFVDQLRPTTRMLVLPHVDNVLGIRHPVARIAAEARKRGVRFIAVDAAQSLGMLPINVGRLGVDVYATSPHKWLQAPKGLGLAYLGPAVRDVLEPMWVTWGQARWADSVRRFEDYGTRNLAAVLALGDAIEFHARVDDTRRQAHHRALRAHAHARVETTSGLAWLSPGDFENGAALYTIGIGSSSQSGAAKASDVSRQLFAAHGIVLRPFTTDGLNGLRLSPNLNNTTADLDRFFDALGVTLGRAH